MEGTGMKLRVSQAQISWEAAHRVVATAVLKAQELGVTINVAVLDSGGNRMAFLRMTGAPLHSITIAEDKAFTAVSFGLPTGRWPQELEKHSEAVRRGIALRPRFVMFGGGQPIRVDGELIGGVGVSGGSERQDEECALAGLAALELKG
jgi:uncharacterized protein GlcG (DUF336 family)